MAGISSLLSYHGRLIYWLILFFHLCPCTGSAPFPKTVIKQIDSFRKNCLWDGKDLHRQGKCLVAWTAACRPKDEGGLGILNLQAQNMALLLKFADKFYNRNAAPWVDKALLAPNHR